MPWSDVLKMWIGRVVFAAAGVILIVTSVSAHSPKLAAAIVTGVCTIGFAIYATIRGLGGGVEGSGKQVIGLIAPDAWYDWVVLGVAILASVIAWVV